ncbi:MAG: hypothetical protein CVU63_02470 [Deltaproteobacteria bacterium HGW-Deltaproteobacteria-20]|nr:MAG: hypothetical protein CVU63_02470 [Deltaproteobacteria bacterium HGW-Deltaproteobacteria-20]
MAVSFRGRWGRNRAGREGDGLHGLTQATVASKVRRVRFPILRFGVVPVVDGPTFRADLSRVCRALGYYLGTTVECRPLPTYAKLVTLLSQGQLDAAWVPPVVAMDCGAMRIARPRIAMVRQRETAYHAVLFTLQDSPIRSLADLQKVRAAWVSPDSASGYLVPLASLRARGVSLSKAFADQIFVGTHEAVARAVRVLVGIPMTAPNQFFRTLLVSTVTVEVIAPTT